MERQAKSVLYIIAFLAIAGALFSFWSLEHFVSVKYHADTSHSLCNIHSSFNCDAVNQSKWSSFLGFPLAGYGLLFYVSIFLFSIFQISLRSVTDEVFSAVMLTLSLLASLLSVILFFISKVDVGAFCLFCVGMYMANFALLFASFFLKRSVSIMEAFVQGLKHLFSWPLIGFGLLPIGEGGSSRSLARRSFLFFAILAVICLPLSEPVVHALVIEPKGPVQGQETPENSDQTFEQWEKQDVAQINIKGAEAGALARDYTKGNPNAPVKIVEFFDYECPACRKMYYVLKDLLDKYPTQISVTLKNYPLDRACNPAMPREIHRFACFGSYFARCAGEQGKFWEATDLVFESEVLNSYETQAEVEQALYSEARAVGIDVNAVKECISSGRQNAKILDDIRSAGMLGVQGTPTVWVNQKKVANLSKYTLDTLVSKLIEQHEAQMPSKPEKSSGSYGSTTF